MSQSVYFDSELIRKYDVAGPRYTSYPTAVQFTEDFTREDYARVVSLSNAAAEPTALSMYVHLPFCHSLCYYCGCTKKITRHQRHGESYLQTLFREIEMQGEIFDRSRPVQQLHFGGGTPTFFDDEQLTELMARLGANFGLTPDDDREYSIELDPRTVDLERLAVLKDLGFNRISLGIQDFDPEVQKAVNRIQSAEDTLALISEAHRMGYESVSVDLIYGLPLQTIEKFRRTLETVVEARPNRLAVYNYAHMPQLFRAQRLIRQEDIPAPETKLALMELTINFLIEAGYRYIGMDHFALPNDELSRAHESGTLQRNFQGYSTHGSLDLVSLGMSSIGMAGNAYSQNLKTIPEYTNAVNKGVLPIWRGLEMSDEDILRRSIIQSIMCGNRLIYSEVEKHFDLDFHEHFSGELEQVIRMHDDGLLDADEHGFEVTPAGRLLVRNIAMVFDAYLSRKKPEIRFSRAI